MNKEILAESILSRMGNNDVFLSSDLSKDSQSKTIISRPSALNKKGSVLRGSSKKVSSKEDFRHSDEEEQQEIVSERKRTSDFEEGAVGKSFTENLLEVIDEQAPDEIPSDEYFVESVEDSVEGFSVGEESISTMNDYHPVSPSLLEGVVPDSSSVGESLVREDASKETNSPSSLSWEEYKRIFLAKHVVRERAQINLPASLCRALKRVAAVEDLESSLGGLVTNILREHLIRHQELLSRMSRYPDEIQEGIDLKK